VVMANANESAGMPRRLSDTARGSAKSDAITPCR
jgi:hypothetical protein